MRILYHHRTRGRRAERVHINSVVEALRELGHEVTVMSLPGTEPEEGKDSKLGTFWGFVSRFVPGIFFEFLELLYNILAYRRMSKILKKERFDLIYDRYAFFCFAGVNIAGKYNLPIVLEVNEICVLDRIRKLYMKPIAQIIENYVFKRATALFVITNYIKNLIIDNGIEEDKIHLTPNAIDPKKFSLNKADDEKIRAKVRARYNLNGKCIIGFQGVIVPWHKVEMLVDCFEDLSKQHGNLHLLIVGGGIAQDAVAKYVYEKGLLQKVTLTGSIPHHEMPDHVAAMDIAVIPNSNLYGSPMKLFEYMAMEKPIVAPRIGPVEDIVRDREQAILFDLGDAKGMRRCIKYLINQPLFGKTLGRNARETVLAKHLWQHHAQKVVRVYEEWRSK